MKLLFLFSCVAIAGLIIWLRSQKIDALEWLRKLWSRKEKPPDEPGAQPPKKEKEKRDWKNWFKAYQISGAVISLVIICFFLNRYFPVEFAVVLKSKSFWFLNLLFLLNIALLEKSTGFVVFIRFSVLVTTIAMILIVGANFVRGGPQIIANIRGFVVEPQHQKEIEKVRASHKDTLAAGVDKEVKLLQETAKTRPLSEEELKKLDGLEAELARIYSNPEKGAKRKEGERVLSGVFKLTPNKIVSSTTQGKELIYRVGERTKFIQITPPQQFWYIYQGIPSYKISEKVYITDKAVNDGNPEGRLELKMVGGKGEMLVLAQIFK